MKNDGNDFNLQMFAEQATALEGQTLNGPGGLPEKSYYNVPTSSAADLTYKTIGSEGDLLTLKKRAESISHSSTKVTVYTANGRGKIVSRSKNTETVIELGSVEGLLQGREAAKKLFTLSLIKIGEQAYSMDTGLYRDTIDFPLHELIDNGSYKALRSARRGFNDGLNILTSLKARATVRKGKADLSTFTPEKSPSTGAEIESGLRVLFTGGFISRGHCYIELNTKINWAPLLQYFTIYPKWGLALKARKYDLFTAIFYLARQNCKALEENGYFKISFRSLQERLGLPDETKTPNPYRDVVKELLDTIAEVQEAYRRYRGNLEPELILTPLYDKKVLSQKAGAVTFLNTGRLKVELKGEYSEAFVNISKTQNRLITAAVKRKQTIADKAIVQAMADRIKEEEKAGKGVPDPPPA